MGVDKEVWAPRIPPTEKPKPKRKPKPKPQEEKVENGD